MVVTGLFALCKLSCFLETDHLALVFFSGRLIVYSSWFGQGDPLAQCFFPV